MARPVIRVERISKRYRIGARQPYHRFSELLSRLALRTLTAPRACWRRARAAEPTSKPERPAGDELWALQDISFEVVEGEVLGIIGRNGAGKSTLLKILSRITEPTGGRFGLRGRLASLLEVGTGFHPELTGRENIYLNGAVLGMTRAEIRARFDEIVAFAETEQFLETPVKHYSSGMYMRLAFAVAAHLQSDILMVDEVLAVGDVGFQRKCLGKMGDVAKTGRTVLMVSHNMLAIGTFCTRALLLAKGRLELDGAPREVVRQYLECGSCHEAQKNWPAEPAAEGSVARLLAARILDENGEVAFDHDIHRAISIEIDLESFRETAALDAAIFLLNADGVCLLSVGACLGSSLGTRGVAPGRYRARCEVPGDFLNDGIHYVTVFIVRDKQEAIAMEKEAVSFLVHDYGAGRAGYLGKVAGAVRPTFPWVVERLNGLEHSPMNNESSASVR